MQCDAPTDRKVRQTLLIAQLSCGVFGAGLLLWGLAPLLLQRITSSHPPSLYSLGAGSLTLFLGVTFIGLGMMIRRGVVWAMWGTAGLSVLLLMVMLSAMFSGQVRELSIFPALLATSTALTSLMALAARDMSGNAEKPPTTSS